MPKLEEICEINPRSDRGIHTEGTLVSFVPMAGVSEASASVVAEEERPLFSVLKGFTPFRRNDVLLAKITPCFENGKIALADISRELGFGSTEFHVLRPDPEKLEFRYLLHFLRQPKIRAYGEKRMTGSGGQRRVPKAFLEELEIPLPPLSEQRRIAAILDKADALRVKRREAIAKLDQLLKSVFLDMFGDPVTNPKAWPVEAFGTFVENKDGHRRPVKSSDREGKKGPYPYYGASGIIDYIDEFIFDGRNLLIAEDGANLLSRSTPIAFIATGKYWVNNHAHVVGENGRANLLYLLWQLNLRDLSPYITGSAQPKLNQSKMNAILIPLAPMSLQLDFAKVAERIDALKLVALQSAGQENELFASLQHRAFNGAA